MVMGNLSVIDGKEAEGPELEDVTMEELSITDTLDRLMAGSVILLTTYDNQRDKDVLIRMKDTPNGKVTQVSKPTTSMEGFVGTHKYWSLYDISINTLSLYPTYVYDPTRYGMGAVFEPNCMVEYESSYGDKDIAVITKVLQDEHGSFYYKLSGEGERVFKEEELTELKK